MNLAFDRVLLTTDKGSVVLSVEEFAALSLSERLRAIFEKRLGFYRGPDLVDTTLALRSLRDVALSRSSPH
jgi:hypothetical protein